jgi:HlyD family secretion protein
MTTQNRILTFTPQAEAGPTTPTPEGQPEPNTEQSGMDRVITRQGPDWKKIVMYGGPGALLILVLAYFLFAFEGGRVYRVNQDRITIGQVTAGTFDDFVPVRGRIAPLSTVYLETTEGGRVDRRLVEDGAIVKAGQPLVVLSNTALQLDVISREADVAEQMNNMRNTQLQFEVNRLTYSRDLVEINYNIVRLKRDLDRKRVLVPKGAYSQADLDAVEDQYNYYVRRRDVTLASQRAETQLRTQQMAVLQSTVQQLNASLDFAKRNLDSLTIKAPIDGRLTALDAEVGQSKERGSRLGQVDSLNAYKIAADVDEFYVARVSVGQKAIFTVDGRDYAAVVHKIYPQIRNGAFLVDFHLTGEKPQMLRVGQAVDLKLQLGSATKAIVIPNGPFYQDTGGNWIFVVNDSGSGATKRTVRLGRRNPQSIEVLEGLQPGERVVVSGYASYAQMDRVEFDSSN